ncbi:DUF6153 family protein [Streptomyces hypolithicus]
MTTVEYAPQSQPVLRVRALLVLGLLVGLLGMHGLAPGDPQPSGHHTAAIGAATAHGTAPGERVSVPDDCDHDRRDGGGGGCHDGAAHADATCASGAVGAGPALPALTPVPGCLAAAAEPLLAAGYGTPDGARAPPTLAELQILRI